VNEFNIPGQRSGFHVNKITEITPQEAVLNASEVIDFLK
jgi:hypothetical protein